MEARLHTWRRVPSALKAGTARNRPCMCVPRCRAPWRARTPWWCCRRRTASGPTPSRSVGVWDCTSAGDVRPKSTVNLAQISSDREADLANPECRRRCICALSGLLCCRLILCSSLLRQCRSASGSSSWTRRAAPRREPPFAAVAVQYRPEHMVGGGGAVLTGYHTALGVRFSQPGCRTVELLW